MAWRDDKALIFSFDKLFFKYNNATKTKEWKLEEGGKNPRQQIPYYRGSGYKRKYELAVCLKELQVVEYWRHKRWKIKGHMSKTARSWPKDTIFVERIRTLITRIKYRRIIVEGKVSIIESNIPEMARLEKYKVYEAQWARNIFKLEEEQDPPKRVRQEWNS